MNETQQIWEDFGSALHAFILRRVRDDHVADDLLQDVFVRIHDNLNSLSDQDRLAAWLYRIARNVIADYHRRHVHSEFDESQVQSEPDSSAENINEQIGQWIIQRIDELPIDYREALTLYELRGIRHAKIAEQIGLSPSGAKSRVQRGRKMLKDSLLRCCHFDFDRRGNVISYQAKADCATCCNIDNGQCNEHSR